MTKNPKPERHKLTILSSKKPIFRFFQNRSLFVKQKISCSEQQNEIRSVWKKQNEKRSVLEKDVSTLVECSLDELNDCSPIAVNLEIINIPESFASADEIFVYRDMTGIVEQNKMLSQSFHNGQSLTMEAPVIGKNFYTPGINQSDVVQRLNNDFCKQIINNKVLDVAPEVIKYCVGLDNVVGMADYVDLPVVVDSEVAIGSSDQIQSKHKLKVFEFPSRNSEQSTSTLWTQKWVGAPGNWINFEHRRYLVAAPLFPQNLTIERRFVAVLPGQYQILAVDKAGNHIGKLKVKTENIDENYERVARKVMLGE